MNLSYGGRLIGLSGPSNLIIAATPSTRPLDANLPQATENAIMIAVKQETDPAKLQAFAQSLLPQYPSAASVLMARAAKLFVETAAHGVGSVGVGFKFQPWKGVAKIAKDAVKIGPLAFIPGAGAAVILASAAAAAGHTAAGKKIGTDLGKNKILSTIANTYKSGYMQANPAFFAKTLILGATDEALHGKNIGKAITDQGKQVTKWLGDKAKYASQAAGVPPTVTPALTAAANIAEGKPIPQDILGAAGAVVGQAVGPAATAALQQGAAFGNQLAQGATGPVLAQIAAAKAALPPAVTHAFDSGLAIQTAQQLQAKGYAAAHALIPPAADGSVAGKVVTALNAQTPDLLSAGMADVQKNLSAGAADLAHNAVAQIVAQPQLAHLSSLDLARHLGVHEPIARVALASMSHEVPGAPIMHPHRLEALVGKHRHRPRPPGSPDQSIQWTTYYGGQAPPAAVPSTTGVPYEPYPQAATAGTVSDQTGVSRGGGGGHGGGGHGGGRGGGGYRGGGGGYYGGGGGGWGPGWWLDPLYVDPLYVRLPGMVNRGEGDGHGGRHHAESSGYGERYVGRRREHGDGDFDWYGEPPPMCVQPGDVGNSYPDEPHPVVVHPAYPATAPVAAPPLDPERYPASPLPSHRASGLGDPPPGLQPTGTPIAELASAVLALPGRALRSMSREFEREIASVKSSGGYLMDPPPGVQPAGQSIKSIAPSDFQKENVRALY
jgi:hypothetical protein